MFFACVVLPKPVAFKPAFALDSVSRPSSARTESISLHRRPFDSSPTALAIAMLGVPFDSVTLPQAVARIQNFIAARKPHQVVTANVDFLVQARRDAELRRILVNADLVLCDGTPLVWASRWLGNALPERVAGSDLVPELLRVANKKQQRVYFLGGSPESNETAVATVRRQFPHVIIAGHAAPPIRPLEQMDAELVWQIRDTRPDLLFVAFGCPKAEKWIALNLLALNIPVCIGVGATIDFLAGRVKRAPRWIQRCGAEWLFRLAQEPRRLLTRYATDLWHFSGALAQQLVLLRTKKTSAHETVATIQLNSHNSELTRDSSSDNWLILRAPHRFNQIVVAQIQARIGSTPTQSLALQLDQVQHIDSTAVAALLRWQKSFRATRQNFLLLHPSAAVEQVFRTQRVRDFFFISMNPPRENPLSSTPSQQRLTS